MSLPVFPQGWLAVLDLAARQGAAAVVSLLRCHFVSNRQLWNIKVQEVLVAITVVITITCYYYCSHLSYWYCYYYCCIFLFTTLIIFVFIIVLVIIIVLPKILQQHASLSSAALSKICFSPEPSVTKCFPQTSCTICCDNFNGPPCVIRLFFSTVRNVCYVVDASAVGGKNCFYGVVLDK